MDSCFYGKPNKQLDEIIKHWNGDKTIKKYLGKIGGNKVEDTYASMYIRDVAEHLFRIPFNSSFEYTDPMVRRFKREIDNISKNYKSGKLGIFRKYFYVPDSIANKSPVTRMFYENVNMAINYERNNMDEYLSRSKAVSSYIRKALISEAGMTKKEAKSYMKEMQDLETKLLRAEGTNEDSKTLYKEYSRLFDRNGGKIIKDYIELMEMNRDTFREKKGDYTKNTVLAVEESRALLDSMGKVLGNGLDRMENVVNMLYDSPLLPKSGRNYIKKIREAKNAVKKGIKAGGYLPHYALDGIIEANYRLLRVMDSKTGAERENAVGKIIQQIETMIPDQAKSRNPLINNLWAKNPFFILTQYSKDVIAFNKINFIHEQYIPAMRRMQKEDLDPAFVRDMRHYIGDTYRIATKGLMDRPDSVNATVRVLMAAETIKSMGLSVTGAIRNGASAAYFFTQNGLLSATNAVRKYHSHYGGTLGEIESEQGFKFTEAGRELVTEGLIPSEGANVSDIRYDPIKNSISYRDKGVLKKLDPRIDWAVGKSLVFHRFTENATRKWMFRIAWIEAFETLQGHNIVDASKYETSKIARDQNTKDLERMATKFAVKAVNSFAFEYAAHAKARAIGGTAPKSTELGLDGRPKMEARDYATAVGEVAFQFLHYPMSFLNLQSKILHGAKDAALSGQWDAPEIKQLLRFAGIWGAVQTLSVATNLDLTNTLENDTVERILDMAKYFTGDDEELSKKRGLLNDFTGPVIGDIFYALNMSQLYKTPDSDWAKMITGYVDYYGEGDVPDWVNPKKKIDTTEKRNMWNRLNVELARWMTKNIPAIHDGRGMDILRHELGWYERSRLKKPRKTANIYAKKFGIEKMLGSKLFKEAEKNKSKKEGEEALRKLSLKLRDR